MEGMGTASRQSQNGNTLVHQCVERSATHVYVCANAGEYINSQNFDGDTALHLALKSGRKDVVNALLICGADMYIRNKLGQTAMDTASPKMRELLEMYKPGLVHAISKGDFGATLRLVRLWCNVNSKIKGNKSALDIAKDKSATDPNVEKCYSTLTQHRPTLELIHAVLSEDVSALKKLLCSGAKCNLNIRFKDSKGWTPATCAIAQHNLEVLQLLMTASAPCNLNIRVRNTFDDEDTVPLYFKTLDSKCPTEIWEFIKTKVNADQDTQRDHFGDTAIFCAIRNGKSASFVQNMITWRNGHCIWERNMAGLTPREVADTIGKYDVVNIIDQYILNNILGQFLINLPIHFYGEEKITRLSLDGKSLVDLTEESKDQQAWQAVSKYTATEKCGLDLFRAAASGDLTAVVKLNVAPYRDQNGYTALIRAIVFNQQKAARYLIIERPQLKEIPDNSNRFPLHYAYALPDDQCEVFTWLLLEKDADKIEHCVDKDGLVPVEYKGMRDRPEVIKMLDDARTLDPYRKRGPSPGPLQDKCS